jgi:Ni/Fe-hydrogenase subunit HybB-like protein
MAGILFNSTGDQERLDSVSSDILRNVRLNRNFLIWTGFLVTALMLCLFAYSIQLRKGLGVTGLRDITSWGMYIANFVFFVASSLVGMLISSIFGLAGAKWIKPVGRIAEIIAVAFSAVAGLVIISDMGRPDRLPYVFIFGRFQSPILWDVTVVTTYFVLSLLLWFIPVIPDMAIAKTRLNGRPAFLKKVYEVLSLRWIHHEAQYKILKDIIRILAVLIIPMAFAIHTVTSWLFAFTLRAGWDSTIFGPYFVSGAFVSGTSAVIIAMYFYRKSYHLEKYLTDDHFNRLAKVLVLVSCLYIYFNINEFIVPGYKLKSADAIHLKELFTGSYSWLFWSIQLPGLIIPVILMLFRQIRKPFPLLCISAVMFAASWLKRYLIVVPPQAHPFLPAQNMPARWMIYTPTLIEVMITLASFIIVLLIITILSKLFPVIPIWEMAETVPEGGSNYSDNQKS